MVMTILISCENKIKYEYDPLDGAITILSQLSTADKVHSVYLSMSYPDRIDSLPGAEVYCYINGKRYQARQCPPDYYLSYDLETQTLLPERNPYTRYSFEATFKPGDKVRVETIKGDLMAWAELSVPEPSKLISVDTATVVKSSLIQDIDGSETYDQEYLEFTVKLEDIKGQDNYFSLDGEMTTVYNYFMGWDQMVGVDGPYILDYETFHDIILEDGFSSGIGDLFESILPINSTHCFSDNLFKDTGATVHLYFPSYYFYGSPYFILGDKAMITRNFRLRFKSIDRSFYNYLRAMNNLICYGYDVSPIIEPTMLPSNVSGGMGIVSIAAESNYEIQLGPFEYERNDDEIFY